MGPSWRRRGGENCNCESLSRSDVYTSLSIRVCSCATHTHAQGCLFTTTTYPRDCILYNRDDVIKDNKYRSRNLYGKIYHSPIPVWQDCSMRVNRKLFFMDEWCVFSWQSNLTYFYVLWWVSLRQQANESSAWQYFDCHTHTHTHIQSSDLVAPLQG